MVLNDAVVVERDLAAGLMECPACGGVVGPWGWARQRVLRRRVGSVLFRPRRGRCRSCRVTHVLLPVGTLVRRRDGVEVIGAALLAWLAGSGHRVIAVLVGVPADTVRGWLRRFAVRAEDVRSHFWRLAHRLDPMLGAIEARGSPLSDALGAVGVAGAAAVRRFGPMRSLWAFVSGATGGRLLCNTDCPYPGVDGSATLGGS